MLCSNGPSNAWNKFVLGMLEEIYERMDKNERSITELERVEMRCQTKNCVGCCNEIIGNLQKLYTRCVVLSEWYVTSLYFDKS